ncbi:hypothetical protein GUJ93_ZPchr0006g44533 [Zizania palustris]|uniref:Uncharacterized protein n=1 Tax=Zizania palustris TaxID=103762 RepID=A0A8J5VWJ9_ZIZPA|nr:hypothetical protein GUJ93_ZPchr0006g44533 [Zizania palustris]KAG8074851.1 hypothetical protein GUJ93_ZPchr0006g44533 [Zizania palustris]
MAQVWQVPRAWRRRRPPPPPAQGGDGWADGNDDEEEEVRCPSGLPDGCGGVFPMARLHASGRCGGCQRRGNKNMILLKLCNGLVHLLQNFSGSAPFCRIFLACWNMVHFVTSIRGFHQDIIGLTANWYHR